MKTNHFHDGKAVGVFIHGKAKATLENNDIIGNDLDGVHMQHHATVTSLLATPAIKGN